MLPVSGSATLRLCVKIRKNTFRVLLENRSRGKLSWERWRLAGVVVLVYRSDVRNAAFGAATPLHHHSITPVSGTRRRDAGAPRSFLEGVEAVHGCHEQEAVGGGGG